MEEINNKEHAEKQERPLSEVEILQAKYAECEKERIVLIEVSQRLKADFANAKKEQEKTLQTFAQYASKEVLLKLMPIFHSFELTLTYLPKELEGNGWAQGVRHIIGQVDAALKDAGVAEIPALGMQFNPAIHEAVAEVESSAEEEGKIMQVMQKGYTLNGEVLFPAKVKVTKKIIQHEA